eukprot:TRINITY_DN1152_c0_g1_i1.p1 TRINITY_DN1152_c0_g1~~TRINITY_DN1152_c0_g1_i1.p1  ORF type:complete len:309 (+),score=53.19 TRINITY_DN1152_c0_g1_i1:165-1091(+)
MAAIVDSTFLSTPQPPFDSTQFALRSNQQLLEKHQTWGCEEPAIEVSPDQTLEIHDGSKVVMGLGAGDSYLIPDFLSVSSSISADEAFRLLKPSLDPNEKTEVNYHQMFHMARKSDTKKCKAKHKPLSRIKGVQVLRDTNSDKIPLYRYSVNNQCQYRIDDFSPTTQYIANKIKETCPEHPHLNHAVILCYRNGGDCIGFHQDKLLDIATNTNIYSVSLGAARPFLLQSPDKTIVQQVTLPHGSLFCLGAKTNEAWLHSLPPLTADPGMRIAVTIRTIATFLDEVSGEVTGQGSDYQTQNWPFGEHTY